MRGSRISSNKRKVERHDKASQFGPRQKPPGKPTVKQIAARVDEEWDDPERAIAEAAWKRRKKRK